MSALSFEQKKELVKTIARTLCESVDGVTKSEEVSKEFYLIATKIQEEAEDMQKEIVWTAAKFFVDDYDWNKKDPEDKGAIQLQHECLTGAYEMIKEEKNESK